MKKASFIPVAVLLVACGGIAAAVSGANTADAQARRSASRPPSRPLASATSWAGEYNGAAAEGGRATVTILAGGPVSYPVSVSVGAPGCGGFIEGTGTVSGNRMTLAAPVPAESGGGQCRVTMVRRGRTLDVSEGPNCQYFHGMNCLFSATATRR